VALIVTDCELFHPHFGLGRSGVATFGAALSADVLVRSAVGAPEPPAKMTLFLTQLWNALNDPKMQVSSCSVAGAQGRAQVRVQRELWPARHRARRRGVLA